MGSVKVIGLLGAAFWLGVVWRRANAAGVWASFIGGLLAWALMSAASPEKATASGAIGEASRVLHAVAATLFVQELSESKQILIMLATQFGLLVLVSLCTRPYDLSMIGPFYARIHTPVGKEDEVRLDRPPDDLPEAATIGMDGVDSRLP